MIAQWKAHRSRKGCPIIMTSAGILLLLSIVILGGCSSNAGLWYKPGAGQVDFNLDDQECRQSAQETAREATLTGKKINPELYATAYTNCLFAKGWTHTPPGTLTTTHTLPRSMAKVEGKSIHIFDRIFELPADMVVLKNQTASTAGVQTQTIFFQGPGSAYLNLIIQHTTQRTFESRVYPVQPPLLIFDRGEQKNSKIHMNWTIFAGEFQADTWVCGLGAYMILDKTRRITLVLTRNIAAPDTAPPPGLTLTRHQKDQVATFQNETATQLLTAFGMPPALP